MRVTVKYGIEEVTQSFANQPTFGALKSDANLRAELGYGDNVKALVFGVEQNDAALVPDDSDLVVQMETAANTKAGQ